MKEKLKLFDKMNLFKIFVLFAVIVFQVWLALLLPEYLSNIIKITMQGGQTGEILVCGLTMLVVSITIMLSIFLIEFLVCSIGTSTASRLRKRIITKMIVSGQKIDNNNFVNVVTNDVNQVQNFICMCLRFLLFAPVLAIGSLIKIIRASGELSLFCIGALIVITIVLFIFYLLMVPRYNKIQKDNTEMSLITSSTVDAQNEIKMNSSQKIICDNAEIVNNSLKHNNETTNILNTLIEPVSTFIMSILSLVIVWVGAYLIDAGTLLIPTMVEFGQYAVRVLTSITMLSFAFIYLARNKVSWKRYKQAYLNISQHCENDNKLQSFDKLLLIIKQEEKLAKRGDIVVIYSNSIKPEWQIDDLYANLDKNDILKIKVNNTNITDYSIYEICKHFVLSGNKLSVFGGGLYDNLLFDNTKRLEMQKLVDNFRINYLAEREQIQSDNLSSGENKKISIIRSLLSGADCIIFDEPTDNLDKDSQKVFWQEVKKGSKAIIIILTNKKSLLRKGNVQIDLSKGGDKNEE